MRFISGTSKWKDTKTLSRPMFSSLERVPVVELNTFDDGLPEPKH